MLFCAREKSLEVLILIESPLDDILSLSQEALLDLLPDNVQLLYLIEYLLQLLVIYHGEMTLLFPKLLLLSLLLEIHILIFLSHALHIRDYQRV